MNLEGIGLSVLNPLWKLLKIKQNKISLLEYKLKKCFQSINNRKLRDSVEQKKIMLIEILQQFDEKQ